MSDVDRPTAVSGGPAIGPWRNAVMVAFALGGVTVSTWGPRLPQLRADLRIGDAAIGLVLAGVTVGSIAGLTASAAVLARLGSRLAVRTMLWLVAAGVATIGIGAGVGHSVPAAAVGFAGVGLGIGSVDVMLNVEGAAVERAAGRTLMPLMHSAWSAGAVLGAGIGAASAAVGLPVAWQFSGEAVVITVAAAVAVRSLPAATPTPATTSAATPDVTSATTPATTQDPAGATATPTGERVRIWLGRWRDRRLLLIGLVMLGVELGEGGANSWLTLAVGDGHHRANAVAAVFFVAFAVGETLARVLGGPLVDRLGRVRTVRVTTALGAVGVLVFIVATPAWLVFVGTLLWAVGVSMGFPLGMSAAADSGPDPAARVSVVASVGYLANLAGPPLIGALSQAVGLLDALWLIVALLVVGFAAAGALRPPPHRVPLPQIGG